LSADWSSTGFLNRLLVIWHEPLHRNDLSGLEERYVTNHSPRKTQAGENPAKRKVKNAEVRSLIAYRGVSGQPKQLPEVVLVTEKAIQSLENGELGAL